MLLTFEINKQLICRMDKEIPVAKSENYLYAQFSFSDEWTGTKTAIFNNGTAYNVILDENNTCLVPWEVITESGFSVSVFCGERITANTSFVKVLPSGYIEGQTPAPPSKTVYEQILEELAERLSADDVIAGDNVTIIKNADGSITISATGGGAVNVDNITIENDNGVLKVKNGGITSAKLSSALNTLINGKAEQYISLYTPTSQIVNAETLSGKWQAAEGFTLRIGGGTDYEQDMTVNKGDVFYIVVTGSPYCTGYIDNIYFDFEYGEGVVELDLNTLINILKDFDNRINGEADARQNADNNLQGQIDAITVSSDVVDVVGTYTDLQNYDTTHIKANDIIKVLQDSTHNDALSYYRWVLTGGVGAWTYVGSEGPYYTKGETDVLLQGKQDALTEGTGIDISNNEISVDFDDVQAKLTAGENININGNTISAILNPELLKFVSSRPSSNIDTNAYYLRLNTQAFPDVSNKATTANPCVVVTYNEDFTENKWRLMVCNPTSVSGGYRLWAWNSPPQSFEYTIYAINSQGTEWVELYETQTNNNWQTYLGGSNMAVTNCKNYIKCSNANLEKELQGFPYQTTDNTYYATGNIIDTSSVDKFQFIMEKYVNNDWVTVGNCDFEELLKYYQNKPLTASNITIATTDWASDNTYTGYGYKADITISGVTASMVADVYFSGTSALLGTLAPFCDTGSGKVTIYCSANDTAVTVDKVVVLQ